MAEETKRPLRSAIARLLLDREDEWAFADCLPGSSAELIRGRAATTTSMNECSPGWFSGSETVILGSDVDSSGEKLAPTFVRFSISTEPALLKNAIDVRLIIACRRRFGGLHTRRRGARVRLLFNGNNLDFFGLKAVPDKHDDYFYRDDRPLPADLPELAGCATLYQWAVPTESLLRDSATQELEIRLDPDVRWDIDYVTLACKTRRRKLSPFADRFVFQFIILVVVGGLAVALLLRLFDRPIAPAP